MEKIKNKKENNNSHSDKDLNKVVKNAKTNKNLNLNKNKEAKRNINTNGEFKKVNKKRNSKEEEIYDSDSSDEDILVRTGQVPREWYNDFDHLGYGINSKKIEKEESEDEIEKFLAKAKSKDWWRNINDEMNNKTIYLSDKDLQIIQRIRSGKYASKKIKDDDEFFERNIEKQIYPLSNHTPSKKAFEPSHHERKMINHLAKLIEEGLIKIEEPKEENFFDEIADIWRFENTRGDFYHPTKDFAMPKPDAPDNDLSYNYNSKEEDISLRKVAKYDKLIEDEFERLNDIYSSTRTIKKKYDIKEEDIIPKVPEPKELKPFPTKDNILHRNHRNEIIALCVDDKGKYIFSGDMAGFVYFSDIITTKTLLEVYINDEICNIQYNSNLSLVTVCGKEALHFIRPRFLERRNQSPELLNQIIYNKIIENIEENKNNLDAHLFQWKLTESKLCKKNGIPFSLYKNPNKGEINYMCWHNKGDYFAILSKNELGASQVHIHNLSSLQYFSPSSKSKGNIKSIAFHSSKPHFYICSESNVLIYDLKQQELIRKFISNLLPINMLALHPGGSDFVAGSLQGKVAWFQSDLSEKPYIQMEQYHETKIKSLCFHNKYNLLSSASDEGKTLIYYAKVFDDFIHDPLIVPLNTLKSAYKNPKTEINSTVFHPVYPWILTAGSSKIINIWS